MRVIRSTSLSMSGVWVPMPALFTSSVMLASWRNLVSTRASDAPSFRSAGKTSTARPVRELISRAKVFRRSRLRATNTRS